ncbi:MAG TPA: hypothetical protein VJB92_01780 [Candidatus Paceibacterota bacterium]
MTEAQLKICQNCKREFVIELNDFSFYEKMGVPAPALCPECRFRRRAVFRNETTLYSRQCALCKKNLISSYNPKSPYTIYCSDCWESDNWDPYVFGRDYDSSRPFFDQFGELMKVVPVKATMVSSSSKLGPNVRSDYINFAGGNKDCYLIFNGGGNENVFYSRGVSFSKDSSDGYFGVKLERCYETVNVSESSGVIFGQNALGALDSSFVLNVSGIQHCFGCVNLRHKSYHFLNESLPKAEYQKRVAEIQGSYSKTEEFKNRFNDFSLKFPRRANSNLKSVNSTGDYLVESKNLVQSFEAAKCEDCAYLFSVKYARDCYDILGFGYDAELMLETVASGYSSRIIGCQWAENSQNIEYSIAIRKSENCFGCNSLKNAKYCILNKKYSVEEYKRLREKIVNELKSQNQYGLFFPPALAPFAYNETVGQENIPFTKDEVLDYGFRWEDDFQMTIGKETLKPGQIPDHINDVTENITEQILACIDCSRNYRITPAELQFYKMMILPVPRRCFYCRHRDRIKRRGPLKIYERFCSYCKKPIKTTFAPEQPEIVYCEACYQKEVI